MNILASLLSLCLLTSALSLPAADAVPAVQNEIEDYSALTAENHPRLIFTNEDFEAIKNKKIDSPIFYNIHNQIIAAADAYVGAPDFKRVLEGKRMLRVSRDALERISYCAYAYKTTGDVKYLKQAERDVITVCKFEDWNPKHYLDTGEMAAGVAFAYDWLYADLSESTKALVRKAFMDLCFAPTRTSYAWFYRSKSNWNQVCNGGLICAALAIFEDCPEARNIIEKGIKTNRVVMKDIYSPDGNYPEGYSYWCYGTIYQVLLLTALETTLGTDAGLSQTQGFDQTGRYMLFMEGYNGMCFNYSDSSPYVISAYAQWYFANKYNDFSSLYLEKDRIDTYVEAAESRLLALIAYYAYKLNLKSLDDIKAPAEKIYRADGVTPVVLVHQNWAMNDTDKFLGIKGGKAKTSHSHLDAGSFVYEAFGARWIDDMAHPDYGLVEAAGVDLWNMNDGSDRWKLTQYNNLHHNTLTVNGKYHLVDGVATVKEVIDSDGKMGAVMDITAPLGELESAIRAAYIEGDKLVISDKVRAKRGLDADIQWTMVTQTKPSLEGQRVKLTAENGRVLYLDCTSETGHVPVIWCTETAVVPEFPVKQIYYECGYRLKLKAGSSAEVTVCLSPEIKVAAASLDKVRKAFVEATVASYAPTEELTCRFMDYASYGKANDVLLMQLYNYVHLPDVEVERLLSEFDWEKGCWKDLDYTAQDRGSWPSTRHVTRMYSLAKIYRSEKSKWMNSPKLKTLLHSAMNWWFDNRPVCPNWWHNDIGVPKKMAAILLMLRDELTPEEIEGGLKVLERSRFGRTGQNKAWLAGNNLMKGLLIDDPVLVKRARDYIAEEIYITEQEGIQPDWSFHQHGPQIQFGNYGLAYADGVSFWLRVLKDSEFAFTEEQTEIVTRLLKDGICRAFWKGVMDPSYCGRQNFINAGPGKAFALAVTAQNMAAALEGDDSVFFANVAAENLLPELYSNTVVGGNYYWRSDCGVWRRPEWYSSIRMHSERTIGFEFTNKENTLANFSADGALILMQDGHEFDNIFAYWDWRKLPGVTAYDDGKALKCDNSEGAKKNHSDHVGGLVYGDAMLATMELNRDGLHALKTAFFFDDCVVNLGADIYSSNDEFLSVSTAIDQIHLDGKVRAGKNWVHHRNRGYVSLDGAPIMLSAGLQKGKWDAIDPIFHDEWDEGEVFKIWFEHPVAGMNTAAPAYKAANYAYALLPCMSAKETARTAKNLAKGSPEAPVKVLRNDDACQAVLHGDILCAAFHKAGTYELAGRTHRIAAPSLLILGADGSKTVSIPRK